MSRIGFSLEEQMDDRRIGVASLDSLEIQIITKVDGLVQFLRRAYLDSKIGEREYEKAKTVFVYDV